MPKLFMLLIGCKPPGRHTEQHDVFFGIGESVKDLIPQLVGFWPEGIEKLHIDAWREVSNVNGNSVMIVSGSEDDRKSSARLFFINLGGYKQNEFEEFHYKMVIAAGDKAEAIDLSKKTAFFMHTGFKGANSHIDDKYGIDVDDIFEIADMLPEEIKQQYRVQVSRSVDPLPEDEIHLGYFKLNSF